MKYEMMELEPFIYTVKRQLLDAQRKHSGELGYFSLEDVELTLALAIQSGAGGKVTLKVFSVGPEFEGKIQGTQTSTVKLKFKTSSTGTVEQGSNFFASGPPSESEEPGESVPDVPARHPAFPIFQDLIKDYRQHYPCALAVFDAHGNEHLVSIGWAVVPSDLREAIAASCRKRSLEEETRPSGERTTRSTVLGGKWTITSHQFFLGPAYWLVLAEPSQAEDKVLLVCEETRPIYISLDSK